MKSFGRSTEIQFFGDRDKISEMPQFHNGPAKGGDIFNIITALETK